MAKRGLTHHMNIGEYNVILKPHKGIITKLELILR